MKVILKYHPDSDMIIKKNTTKAEIIKGKIEPTFLCEQLLNKYNACIILYGQTGSGKTYTFMNEILPFILNKIKDKIIKITSVELYKKEKIQNEISKNNISAASDVFKPISSLMKNRITKSTGQNDNSSRSHFILRIYLEDDNILTLVDLAGSESASRSLSDYNERKAINQSLLYLGNCIRDISENGGKKTNSFRSCNLTYELKEEIGGNFYTEFVICVKMTEENKQQSIESIKMGNKLLGIEKKITIVEKKEKKKKVEKIEKIEEVKHIPEKTEDIPEEAEHIPETIPILEKMKRPDINKILHLIHIIKNT